MGWSGGTRVIGVLIESLNQQGIDDSDRYNIYSAVVQELSDMDWDNLYEPLGEDPEYDRLFAQIYPDHDVD